MGIGIIVCGLNGAGKSTLGRALAEKLQYRFIDIEDLYFPKTDPHYLYASPRTREEVAALLSRELETHENFVLASVKGDFGEAFSPFFRYAVLIDVPREIRLQRVRARSFEKFGDRMLPGGDLYEREAQFFDLVKSRTDDSAEKWVRGLRCPVIRLDGTGPIPENVELVIRQMQRCHVSQEI